MKSRRAFSLVEIVVTIALLGILAALTMHIFASSWQTAVLHGNPMYASKAMRALSVMDTWNSRAVSAKAVANLESFSPSEYNSMPAWNENADAIVFKFVFRNGENVDVCFKALEVGGKSFRIHEWGSNGNHVIYDSNSLRFSDDSAPDVYRVEFLNEPYFGVPVITMNLFILRRVGGEFVMAFKTEAENE